MDGLTFFSKLFEALAWPAVALINFFAVKTQLLNLFPFLKRLKYKDFQLEFGEKLREMTEKAKVAIPEPAVEELPVTPPRTLKEQLYEVAEISPRSAIVEAWLQVEHAAQEVVRARGLTNRPVRLAGPKRLRDYMEEGGILTSDQREIFERLRGLRNQAVHYAEVEVPLDQVYEYVDLALALAAQLRKAGKAQQ